MEEGELNAMRIKAKTAKKYLWRLNQIADIIEGVDNRCMAVDGPVSRTLKEMTDDEMRKIYKLAKVRILRLQR